MVNLEMLAAAQHEIWSRWMRWMFAQGYFRRTSPKSPGDWVMPEGKAERWMRQMNTEYADLSEEERESDRKVVREHMPQFPTACEEIRREILMSAADRAKARGGIIWESMLREMAEETDVQD